MDIFLVLVTLILQTFKFVFSRYRLRVIAMTQMACNMAFQPANHKLKLIAKDGRPVEPVDVDYTTLTSGKIFFYNQCHILFYGCHQLFYLSDAYSFVES